MDDNKPVSIEYKAKKAEYARERRKRAIEQGLCTYCFKEKPEPGYSTCSKCRKKRVKSKYYKNGKKKAKNNRKKAVKNGVCTFCLNAKAEPGYRSCRRCREKEVLRNKERRNKRNEERRLNGLCINCGKNPADTGMATCSECREKRNAGIRARNASKTPKERIESVNRRNALKREKYYLLKEQGMCCSCGLRKAMPDHTTCLECTEKKRSRDRANKDSRNAEHRNTYAWYKTHGICCRCGVNDAEPGRPFCLVCRMDKREESHNTYQRHKVEYQIKNNEYSSKRIKKALDTGYCRCCKRRPADPGYKSCSYCRARNRNNAEKRRRRDGITPRWLMGKGELCAICGKPSDGKKLCPRCYETSCNNLIKARANVDYENHTWRKHEDARYKENRRKYGRFRYKWQKEYKK